VQYVYYIDEEIMRLKEIFKGLLTTSGLLGPGLGNLELEATFLNEAFYLFFFFFFLMELSPNFFITFCEYLSLNE
jgi:hypothetical protein